MRRTFTVILAVFFLTSSFARANTFLVINTADGGAGSLRQPIVDANNNPGYDTIAFAIPGVFVHTITLIASLPIITDQVLIDGYTEPGSTQNTLANGDNAVLLIEVQGSSAVLDVFNVEALGCTIRGLVINGATKIGGGRGIILSGGAVACVVEGCFIGTDPTGTIARPNVYGIVINGSAANSRIGGTTPAARNIISGNTANSSAGTGPAGIFIEGASNAIIQGNFIGVDASGANALPNSQGMEIDGNTNFIGGSTSNARNIISGNSVNGIFLDFNHSTNFIQGNFIGTDVTGTQAVGNGQHGIFMTGNSSFATGNNVISGNVVSGNDGAGVYIHAMDDQSESNNQVQSNFIGTAATGSNTLGNNGGGGCCRPCS